MFPLSLVKIDMKKTEKVNENYSYICNHLYIGNINSLEDANKFDIIINCTKHIAFPDIPNKTYIRIPINDDPRENANLLYYVNALNVLKIIHEGRLYGKNILVHCHAGMQRSCAVVALYLMKFFSLKPERAVYAIRTKRIIAFYPEPTFTKALYTYYTNNNKNQTV